MRKKDFLKKLNIIALKNIYKNHEPAKSNSLYCENRHMKISLNDDDYDKDHNIIIH